jgi:hypothetical protein
MVTINDRKTQTKTALKSNIENILLIVIPYLLYFFKTHNPSYFSLNKPHSKGWNARVLTSLVCRTAFKQEKTHERQPIASRAEGQSQIVRPDASGFSWSRHTHKRP